MCMMGFSAMVAKNTPIWGGLLGFFAKNTGHIDATITDPS